MSLKKTLFTLFFIPATMLMAQTETFELTINITDVEVSAGRMAIAIYNTQESFIKPEKEYLAFYSEATQGTSVAKIKLPKGEYAIALFHDVNNDGKMNTNAIGIPEEPYGFSNDASGLFGAPTYKKAAFHLSKSSAINISL